MRDTPTTGSPIGAAPSEQIHSRYSDNLGNTLVLYMNLRATRSRSGREQKHLRTITEGRFAMTAIP